MTLLRSLLHYLFLASKYSRTKKRKIKIEGKSNEALTLKFAILSLLPLEMRCGGRRYPIFFFFFLWLLVLTMSPVLVVARIRVTNTSCSGFYSLGLLEQEVLKMFNIISRKRSCNGLRVSTKKGAQRSTFRKGMKQYSQTED